MEERKEKSGITTLPAPACAEGRTRKGQGNGERRRRSPFVQGALVTPPCTYTTMTQENEKYQWIPAIFGVQNFSKEERGKKHGKTRGITSIN